jgi:hypothetical protein
MDKFLGRAKGQKATAASGENEVELIILDELSEMSEGEGVAATTSITLTQLVQQQKVLGDQIAALCEMDF